MITLGIIGVVLVAVLAAALTIAVYRMIDRTIKAEHEESYKNFRESEW